MIYAYFHWLYDWAIGLGGIGVVISAGLWALWYFTPPFLSDVQRRNVVLHIAAIATGITVASTYLSSHYFNLGYSTAINKIAAKDKEATHDLKKAVSDAAACDARNGVWDTVDGVCN